MSASSQCYPACNVTTYWRVCNHSSWGSEKCADAQGAWKQCCVTPEGQCTLGNESKCGGTASSYDPAWCGVPDPSLAALDAQSNAGGAAQLVGVLIMFIGTTLSVMGLNGQKWGLLWNENLPEDKQVPVCKNWRWFAGFLCFFVGFGFDFCSRAGFTQIPSKYLL